MGEKSDIFSNWTVLKPLGTGLSKDLNTISMLQRKTLKHIEM